MARQRMIHPSFFTDGELWEALPDWGLVFYVGLWCEAEDSGCFEGHPSTLKNRILPARPDVSIQDVEKVLGILEANGWIQRYEANGHGRSKAFYWLVNFQKHQRIDYPTPPKLPLPEWIVWHGEEEHSDGAKGESGYKQNRRRWHYEVM